MSRPALVRISRFHGFEILSNQRLLVKRGKRIGPGSLNPAFFFIQCHLPSPSVGHSGGSHGRAELELDGQLELVLVQVSAQATSTF
jgi:hypothetical protein